MPTEGRLDTIKALVNSLEPDAEIEKQSANTAGTGMIAFTKTAKESGRYLSPMTFNAPLPSNIDAEKAILGAILLDNSAIASAAETLTSDDLYSPFHASVYSAMLELYQTGRPIDPILLSDTLKQSGRACSSDSVTAIANLSFGLPYFADISGYIENVLEKKRLRDLIRVCGTIQSAACADDQKASDVLNEAERAIFDLTNQPTKETPARLHVLAEESFARTRRNMQEGRTVTGVPTGLIDLDARTGGWQPSDLVIVAARPSMGKTALMLQMAVQASKEGRVGLICSLEMSKEQVVDRMICSAARINLFGYRHATLLPYQMEQAVAEGRRWIPGTNLLIDDTPSISPMQVLAKARRVSTEFGRLDFIAVDYIQLMGGGIKKRYENRTNEVSQISRELKAIAKELNAPVMALSQLSRAPEARNPPRPMLSDLRESGGIEQDADVVLMIYREEYYKPDAHESQGIAELLLKKHRNGPTGDLKVSFLKQYARFDNLREDV